MRVWIVRCDQETYWITSSTEPPPPDRRGRFRPFEAGLHIILPADQAHDLLGFEIDLGGCVRRELLVIEATPAAGTERVEATTDHTENTE